jgi:hypothetical protein
VARSIGPFGGSVARWRWLGAQSPSAPGPFPPANCPPPESLHRSFQSCRTTGRMKDIDDPARSGGRLGSSPPGEARTRSLSGSDPPCAVWRGPATRVRAEKVAVSAGAWRLGRFSRSFRLSGTISKSALAKEVAGPDRLGRERESGRIGWGETRGRARSVVAREAARAADFLSRRDSRWPNARNGWWCRAPRSLDRGS